ncbi:hypothetical protein [Streptomyces sp. DvalAA-19]|uniref:hypothetical protein n=1 Tax=Streptomyces sp. DvalAA-19 TaxID=1839761 RepID=UPI001EFC0FAE|nr:hypothetical protein [Streptomyces sp. DvalAA-19]
MSSRRLSSATDSWAASLAGEITAAMSRWPTMAAIRSGARVVMQRNRSAAEAPSACGRWSTPTTPYPSRRAAW